MDGLAPKVTVADVKTDGDAATATLRTTWSFKCSTWSYVAPVKLSRVDDTWRIAWSASVVAPELAADDRLRVRTTAADRGDILSARDEPIVTERQVDRIGIDKTKVPAEQAGASARTLAGLADIDPEAYATRVEAAGAQAFVEALTARPGSDAAPSDAELEAIPGAVALGGSLPLAPTRGFAQPLVGVVGEATAETVQKSKGSVQAGDMVGLSGLAARYDDQLRGDPGVTVEAVPAEAGAKARVLFTGEAKAGTPLRTTIDLGVQGTAERLLTDVEPATAIVAVQPSTGKVVALASGPGGKGADTAASGRYAPGSTFKLVTALAFLRGGLDTSSRVSCTESVTVEGRRFTNYSDYPPSAVGDVPLLTAIANSCNTAMIAMRDKAPQDELVEGAVALGLGPDLDLGYPAFLGSVPGEAEGTERAASMIGQGRIEASPLAMAVVAASIARGERVTPTLLADSPTKAAAKAAKPLTPKEASQLRTLFRAVVSDGSGSFLADVPGPARGGQDRHRRVRHRHPATHARLDDRDAARSRCRRVRGRRRVGLADRRPAAEGVPAQHVLMAPVRERQWSHADSRDRRCG
jgi:cell division protein FtsI/penicillin-binding protein 2